MKIKSAGLGPTLIELIIAVLLLSVASAICVKIFAGAKLISDSGADLSRASVEAQSAAECFKASGGDAEKTASLLGGTYNGKGFSVLYDGDWNVSSQGDFILTGIVSEEDGLKLCKITVADAKGEIFGITAASHGEAAS